jgi:hypothetical protein
MPGSVSPNKAQRAVASLRAPVRLRIPKSRCLSTPTKAE